MNALISNLDSVLASFWATIRLTVVSAIFALILGTILATMRVAPTPVFRLAGTVYVNTLRNTPLTLVLLFCSLGISNVLKLNFSDDPSVNGYWFAVLGLSAYTSAFVCESLRAGIGTVSLGQAEAARAIGLTFVQSLRLIILPQAFRSVIGPLGSVLIALTKNTTVVIVAGYAEAAYLMSEMIYEGSGTVPIFLGFALGFIVLTLPTGFFFSWLSKRMAVVR
ncbi:glutamate ABC transporter permease [Sphaerisporangium melleum]|uniref:Glutamate ABC transporter permease n=1 Tax=Sphaerisporangium melleum TaxID=321316 RepID=A0A917VIG9_9ACTN|nr:amino acid ABC transporter permease [Sphaerisporangium melleum]GGK82856.1 glutamate ABC transporter permease [Sphaerisporangium melleum]GII69214.1 glutamate ABC transporter permease [Sphaerisporangium melleum]